MRKSPLARSTKPLKRRARKGDDPKLRKAWEAKQTRCAACHRPTSVATFPPFSTHHILNGAKRIDCVHNFLLLCGKCHAGYHGQKIPMESGGYWPMLTPGMILALKHETEPETFAETLAWLQEQLDNRGLLDPEVLPMAFYILRRKWEPVEETP